MKKTVHFALCLFLCALCCGLTRAEAGVRVSIGPKKLVKKPGAAATVTARAAAEDGSPLSGLRLTAYSNHAERTSMREVEPGLYRAVMPIGRLNAPDYFLAVVAFRQGGGEVRAAGAAAPIFMQADIPGVATPGASVEARIGGRAYGPAPAGPDGSFSIPVEISPDDSVMNIVLSNEKGESVRQETPLDLPSAASMHVFAMPDNLTADGKSTASVFAYSATGAGEISASAKLGTMSAPKRLGGGLTAFEYKSPAKPSQKMDEILVRAGAAQSGIEIAFTDGRPARIDLTIDEDHEFFPLESEVGLTLEVFDAGGRLMAGAQVGVEAAFGQTVETTDLRNGLYALIFRLPESADRDRLTLTGLAWPADATEKKPENAVRSAPVEIKLTQAAAGGGTLEAAPGARKPASIELKPPAEPAVRGGQIQIVAEILDAEGGGVPGKLPELKPSAGKVGPLTDKGDGTYAWPLDLPDDLKDAELNVKVFIESLSATLRIPIEERRLETLSAEAHPESLVADGKAAVTIAIKAADQLGGPVDELKLAISAEGGALSSVSKIGGGNYQAIFIPEPVTAPTAIEATVEDPETGKTGRTTVTAMPPGTPCSGNPASVQPIEINPQQLRQGAGKTAQIKIQATDDSGCPMEGLTPQFSAGGGEIGGVSEIGKGKYAATYAPPQTAMDKDEIRVTVSANGKTISDSAAIVLLPPDAAQPSIPKSVSMQLEPSSIVADGQMSAAVTVRVSDQFGEPFDAAEVSIVAGSGTALAVANEGGGVYSAAFQPEACSPGGDETFTATARFENETAVDAAAVHIIPRETEKLEIEPDGGELTVGETVKLSIKALDANGLPNECEAIDLTASGGSVGAPSASGAGSWSASFTAPNEPGRATVQAATKNSSAPQTATAEFDAAPNPCAAIELKTDKTKMAADGSSFANLAATVKDSNGKPLKDETLTWEVQDGGGQIADSGPTSGSGIATAQYTAGNFPIETTLIATCESDPGVSASVKIKEESGPISNFQNMTCTPGSLDADGARRATVEPEAVDDFGNPAADKRVDFFLLGGDGGVLSAAFDMTDDEGKASVFYTTDELCGAAIVEARSHDDNTISESCTIQKIAKIPASISLASSASAVVANGASTLTLTGTALDAGGCPVAGATITLTETGSGSAPQTATTGADGTFSALYASGTTAGTFSVTAKSALRPTVMFIRQLEEVPGPPAAIALTAAPQAIVANGASQSTITAVVSDAFGNLVQNGQTVTFTAAAGSLSSSTATTSNGQAAVTLASSTTAGAVRITAAAGSASANEPGLIEFTHGAPTQLTASGSLDGTAGADLTLALQLLDANGNLVDSDSSTTLTFSAGGSSAAFPNGASPTLAAGEANLTLNDTAAESFALNVSGLPAGVAWTAPTINIAHGPPARFEIQFGATSATAGGALNATVRLLDAYGNLAGSDNSTRLQPTVGGSATLSPTGPITVAAGVASVQVSNNKAENIAFGLSDPDSTGVDVSASQNLTFLPGPGVNLAIPAAPLAASAGSPLTVTFELRDAHGNLVDSDSSTSFTVSVNGSASIAESQPVALSAGRAAVTVTDNFIETVTLSVAGLGGGVSYAPQNIVVGSAALDRVDIVPPANSSVDNTMTVTVRLLDALGNVATDNSSTRFTLTVNGSASVTTPQPVAFAAGVATVLIADHTAESISIGLADPDGTGIDFTDTATADFTPGAPSAVDILPSATPSNPTMENIASVDLTVRDQYGNAIPADSSTILYITVDGSATIGNMASAGTIVSGGGTQSASVQVAAGAATVDALDIVNETVQFSVTGCNAACGASSADIKFIVASAQIKIAAPGSTSSNAKSVTINVLDEFGDPAASDSSTTFTLNAGGSATISNATAGSILSGSGTAAASIRVANGAATVDVSDLVDEAATLSISGGDCDVEWGGTGSLACHNTAQLVFSGAGVQAVVTAPTTASGGSVLVTIELLDANGGIDETDSSSQVALDITDTTNAVSAMVASAGSAGTLLSGSGTTSTVFQFQNGVVEAVVTDSENEAILFSLSGGDCGAPFDCSSTAGTQLLGPTAVLLIVDASDAVVGTTAAFTVVALDENYQFLSGDNASTFNVDVTPAGATLSPSAGPFTLTGGIANFTLFSNTIQSYDLALSGGSCDAGVTCGFGPETISFANNCPTASFAVSPSSPICYDPGVNYYTFTNTGTSAGASFAWDFDDDGGADSTVENPTEDFGGFFGAGDYDVRLITSKSGCSISTTQSVTLKENPIVDFTFTRSQCLTVDFTDASQACSLGIASQSWSFGDGSCPGAAECGDLNPTHTFASPGNYQVTFTVNSVETKTKTVPAFGAGFPISEIALNPSVGSVEADGASTINFTSGPITDCAGDNAPDGEPITVSTNLGVVQTADADGSAGGIQVLTSGGTISFTVRASETVGTATVGAKSVNGGANGWAEVDFTEPAIPTPAQVAMVAPGDGSTDVPLNAVVRFTFDKPLDPSSFSGKITLEAQSGCSGLYNNSISHTYLYDTEDNAIEITADAPFDPNECYLATINQNIKDVDNLSLAADATVSFQTGALNDVQPPVVSNVSASPLVFSPDGDGVKDFTTITANLQDPENSGGTLALFIFLGGMDNLVSIFQTYSGNGAQSVVWDGRDDAGNLVGNGTYDFLLLAVDAAGNESDYDFTQPDGEVTVNSSINFGDFGP